MKRRDFCRTAIATGVYAGCPLLFGCDSGPPLATGADSSVRGVSLDGAEVELERAAIRELGEAMSGPVLLSGDPRYDESRRIWNGMHDKRPALIARCLNSEDVSLAVTFARERDLLVAVRGGGHSWPGKSVCDDGLMIDLSPMHAVRVDPGERRAFAGGGALLNGLDNAALGQGLVTTAGVVSHTGVGGFTLGGGFGRLNRSYGLAVDNLKSAEIVTADGRVHRINAYQNGDLFWAIRGGGGNFGVVTEFEFQLHPFNRKLLSGEIVWPLAQARDVLEFYAEWADGLSDELYVGPSLMTRGDGTGVVAMEVLYNGDPERGEKELAPLRRVGRPARDDVRVQDYMTMQTSADAATAHGVRSYAKSGMVREMTQGLIDAMLDGYVSLPNVFLSNHVAGGAVGRVGELETAFPHRNARIMLVLVALWQDPDRDPALIEATREWYAALEPYTGGYYDNIEYDGEGARGNYGPAYPRLARIKREVDPGNLFRLNSNIRPAA